MNYVVQSAPGFNVRKSLNPVSNGNPMFSVKLILNSSQNHRDIRIDASKSRHQQSWLGGHRLSLSMRKLSGNQSISTDDEGEVRRRVQGSSTPLSLRQKILLISPLDMYTSDNHLSMDARKRVSFSQDQNMYDLRPPPQLLSILPPRPPIRSPHPNPRCSA